MQKRTAKIVFGVSLFSAQIALTFVPTPFNMITWGGLLALAAYFLGYGHALNPNKETREENEQ